MLDDKSLSDIFEKNLPDTSEFNLFRNIIFGRIRRNAQYSKDKDFMNI